MLGSLDILPWVDSWAVWARDMLTGMEDTLLDMQIGLLSILLQLEDSLGLVGDIRDSPVLHLLGSLDEMADTLAGLQDIQG